MWFSLSDEGVEDASYDSYAMRRFLGLDFAVEQVPDATTLLHFRHLLEQHGLGEQLVAAQSEMFEEKGWIMRGGSIVDAIIIAVPSSTKNATGTRDPQMRQTKKGNQWHFGMKAHIVTDAGYQGRPVPRNPSMISASLGAEEVVRLLLIGEVALWQCLVDTVLRLQCFPQQIEGRGSPLPTSAVLSVSAHTLDDSDYLTMPSGNLTL